jgi:hypothetical protein
MGAGEKQWLPLESNPEVMDAYVRGCGVAQHTPFLLGRADTTCFALCVRVRF